MTFWKSFLVAVLLSLFTLSLSFEEENELGAGERSKRGITRPPAMANMTTPGPEAIQDIGNKVTGALGDNDDDDDDEDDEEDEADAEDDSESDSEESDEEEDDEPTAATARVPPTTPAAAPAVTAPQQK